MFPFPLWHHSKKAPTPKEITEAVETFLHNLREAIKSGQPVREVEEKLKSLNLSADQLKAAMQQWLERNKSARIGEVGVMLEYVQKHVLSPWHSQLSGNGGNTEIFDCFNEAFKQFSESQSMP